MSAPRSSITVLWSGTIHQICKLTIFTDVRIPNKLLFDMYDSVALIATVVKTKNPYMTTFKVVHYSGDIELLSGESPTELNITEIVNMLSNIYINTVNDLYKKEIENVRSHH